MSSRRNRRKNTWTCRSSATQFSDHASTHMRQHYRDWPFHIYDGAGTCARPQVLVDINKKGQKQIMRLLDATFPNCGVEEIKKVNSPSQYGMYLLRKEEMWLTKGVKNVREVVLYHVTSKSRALESLTTGLDWRRTQRAKFGCGVSFSDDADYSNYYADRSPTEDTRVIIVCSVLIRKTYQLSGKPKEGNTLIVPPGKCDTTMSPSRRVYVKYNDYEFYPMFFVYFRRIFDHFTDSKYFLVHQRQPKKKEYSRKSLQEKEEILRLEMEALCINKSRRRRQRSRKAVKARQY